MDWFEFWMKGLMGLLVLLLVGLVGALVFIACDSINLEEQESTGRIASVDYHPPYTTTTMVSTGRSTIPVTNYHPARYEVCVYMDSIGDGGCGNMSRAYWESVRVGQRVSVTYGRGRFSRNIYIRGLG